MSGYGTPVVTSDRPVLGLRYGVHLAYVGPGGRMLRRDEVGPRHLAGFLFNTPRGALWLYFRRWAR
jgi:hypothetical protein